MFNIKQIQQQIERILKVKADPKFIAKILRAIKEHKKALNELSKL